MKTTSITLTLLFMFVSATIFAQVDPATGSSTSPQGTPAKKDVYQTSPTPSQANPFGTTQPSATPSNNPFGTTQQPNGKQTPNDYHLTQPTTSPMGAQMSGTQSGTLPAPYNQQPNDLIQVQRDQLPGAMVETLQNPTYSGWENSTIYYNRSANEYSLDVGSGTDIKNYRFDSNGNPVQQDSVSQNPVIKQ
jgi:hypothetical protein